MEMTRKDKIQLSLIWGSVALCYLGTEILWRHWYDTPFYRMFIF